MDDNSRIVALALIPTLGSVAIAWLNARLGKPSSPAKIDEKTKDTNSST